MNNKPSFIYFLLKWVGGILVILFVSYALQTPGGFWVALGTTLAILWSILSFLFDKFWGLILIGFVVILLRENLYWFRDIEKDSEDVGEKLREWAEKDVKYANSIAGKERAKESDEQLKKFIEAHNNYVHLVERFEHDKRKGQIKKDWVNYLKSVKTKLDCQMDYGADLPMNMLRNTGRKDYLAGIKMQEIEKRFKELAS